MVDGTAWRLVSRCTTVEDVVRVFRALATPDGLEGVAVTGVTPRGGTQVRVCLTLASKAVVLDGEAVVTAGGRTLGVRFVKLDARGKGLLAHMVAHRGDAVPPPVPRHLVPLGAAPGVPVAARGGDEALAMCVVEPMAASGPVARPQTPPVAPVIPVVIASERPERPKREMQKTLMGMPTLGNAARSKPPTAPPPVAPAAPSAAPMMAVGAPPPAESMPVPKPRAEGTETGPTQPTRGPTEPSPVLAIAAHALTAASGPIPGAFDAVPTVPTPVPNLRRGPGRIDGAPSGPVDDLPTVPNEDIVTDVAVALPDLPASDDVDPLAEPPAPLAAAARMVAPKSVPVYPGPAGPAGLPGPSARPAPPMPAPPMPVSPGGAMPYVAPPPYAAAPPHAPPYVAPAMAPAAGSWPPPVVQPGSAPYPAPVDWRGQVPQGVDRDGDMTEIVQLMRPPRRRWPVIAVTSGVIVIGVAVMVYIAASRGGGGGGGAGATASPAPSPAPTVVPPAPPPTTPTPPGPAVPTPANPVATAPAAPIDAAVAPAPAPPPPANGPCNVAFSSSPAGAEVVVGGKVLGQTPFTAEVPCRGFSVTFRRNRYQSLIQDVAARATTVDVRLERPGFKVRVTSRPAGALVRIGGVDAGKTPRTITLPGYETTSIELSKAGFAPTTQRVYAGKSGQKLDVKLKPRRR